MNRLYHILSKQFLEELLIYLHENGYKWKGKAALNDDTMVDLLWPSRNGDLGIYIDEDLKLLSHCNFSKVAKQEKGKIRIIQNKSIRYIKRIDELNVYERIDRLKREMEDMDKVYYNATLYSFIIPTMNCDTIDKERI
ncbi:MAG: hypothetical protein HXO06_00420 [Prevotella salivae]|uniref:hypothetical protein n=1 Tax=Segatella salivae TaxID=228604 RepID=UPI001CAB4292|nr:hypothetical protein [Segatella salivae]MBF1543640.1 hypothetical protein [Segatella salivae]